MEGEIVPEQRRHLRIGIGETIQEIIQAREGLSSAGRYQVRMSCRLLLPDLHSLPEGSVIRQWDMCRTSCLLLDSRNLLLCPAFWAVQSFTTAAPQQGTCQKLPCKD